jgi:parallel beta-helix repeat protein/predicted outer membrane repeat protein
MKRNWLFLVFLPALISFNYAVAGYIEVSGNVSGVWDVDTVKVIGDIQVREVESLFILPGVTVEFQGRYIFYVNGQIVATGTQDMPVIFTMADTTGFHNDTIPQGGWKGIRFDGLSPDVDSSLFHYCWFGYGKAVSEDSLMRVGGVMSILDFNKLEISHCTFEYNKATDKGGALYLNSANILLRNNHFTYNSAGRGIDLWGYGGAICSDNSESIIIGNTFSNNLATGIGGGLAIRFSDCPVFFNIFQGNQSGIGGAMAVLHVPECKYVISNNLIINNISYFFGGGVSNNNSSPVWVNNTITGNSSYSYGGGFYCMDSVNPKVYNNIIYGNQAPLGTQVYLWQTNSQASFYHCNIEGGLEGFAGSGSGGAFVGEYINNIDADPLFENSALGDFRISNVSPCVDTGMPDTTSLMIPESDLAGEQRIVGEYIDIGAYENQFTTLVPALARFDAAVFYPPFPNPAAERVTFSFYLLQSSDVTIRVYNAEGRMVKTMRPGVLNRGKHQASWEGISIIKPGVYCCVLTFGSKSLIQKIVIMDSF